MAFKLMNNRDGKDIATKIKSGYFVEHPDFKN
jgi:hypothetical protein